LCQEEGVLKFENKVVLVTGAGSGIGRTTALEFLKEGAKTVLVDINEKSLNTVLSEVGSQDNVLVIRADVSKKEDVQGAVKRAIDHFDGIDILINNAGTQVLKPLHMMPEESWDIVIDTNLKGTYLFSKYTLPQMMNQRQGVIINIASNLGLQGLDTFSTYSASKGGIIALTKCMAIEYASYGIRVNCVCPGSIRTPLQDTVLKKYSNPQEILERASRKIPLGRIGTPEDIAYAVLFLASSNASYATGALLVIDGGVFATASGAGDKAG